MIRYKIQINGETIGEARAEDETSKVELDVEDEDYAAFLGGKVAIPDVSEGEMRSIPADPTIEAIRDRLEVLNGELVEVAVEKADTSLEDFLNGIFDKTYAYNFREEILNEIVKLPRLGRFATMAPQEAEAVYERMVRIMLAPEGWSLGKLMDGIRHFFPTLEPYELERIARTEAARIAHKARELEFNEVHGDTKRYRWIGPTDYRTSQICDEIKRVQPAEGLPLDQLKDLVNATAAKYGSQANDWVPHINCRHTFVRVFDVE